MGERTSLDAITAWIAANVDRLDDEPVARAAAAGRVAAHDVVATAPLPADDYAALDGVALRAAETVGASAYNPLAFRLVDGSAALPPGGAVHVAAGAPLPPGADTVVAHDQVEIAASCCTIVEPAEPGSGVDRAGAHVAAGAALIRAGQRVRPSTIGALAAAGIVDLAVTRRPRVRLVPTRDGDTDRDLLSALIGRDGGIATTAPAERARATLSAALRAPGADLVLVVGGTGPGADDHAAAALADAGALAFHGVAIQPGDTAGVGRLPTGVPVFLLPGAPAACLWAYELIAGPALRRLGGRPIGLPYGRRRMTTARKIVSNIGVVDVCPVVRTVDDRIEPIAGFGEAGLGAALRADGVVIVPEGSEGHARDTEVLVYLFDE
jgi:molybdopterin molybdotransferase